MEATPAPVPVPAPVPLPASTGKKFTLLVKIGEDHPAKWNGKAISIDQLKSQLIAEFGLKASSVFLYFDKEFAEYIKWPHSLDEMPHKAKVLVLPPDSPLPNETKQKK
jgi:hypothetical protein